MAQSTVRAVTVTSWGKAPTFSASHSLPSEPAQGTIRVKVLASGLHRLVRSQALGTHYSARQLGLPYVPGSDGVGLTSEGKKVYFNSIATGGAFAEYVDVNPKQFIELSDEADPVQVAGLVNPGMSSWMAMTTRTSDVNWKEATVVILGVTTQSGKVAVHFARALGVQRIIGIGRDEAKMKSLDLDQAIVLKDKIEETDFSKVGDVDVVLDYLWGPVVVAFFTALKSTRTTQYVNVGSMAGLETPFPAALLRSKDIVLRGSGPGAWSFPQFGKEAPKLVKAVEKLPKQDIKTRGLDEIDEAWKNENERTVFVP